MSKTLKSLLEKDEDPYIAMLTCRTTPLSSDFSQAELLMRYCLHTNLTMMQLQVKLFVPNFSFLKAKKRKQKTHNMQFMI